MGNNSFKENFAPSVVLVVICLVATALLAGTYQVTAPVIAQVQAEQAAAARAEVLPGATAFEQVDASLQDGVIEVYKATDGAEGVVITSAFKGFGGDVTVMTGIDLNGEITGVKVTDAANETPGLGTKATVPEHLNKFVGNTAITNVDGGEGTRVDGVSGATYTSNAVFNSVNAALAQYAELGGAL